VPLGKVAGLTTPPFSAEVKNGGTMLSLPHTLLLHGG
jgi:hypothetical protein